MSEHITDETRQLHLVNDQPSTEVFDQDLADTASADRPLEGAIDDTAQQSESPSSGPQTDLMVSDRTSRQHKPRFDIYDAMIRAHQRAKGSQYYPQKRYEKVLATAGAVSFGIAALLWSYGHFTDTARDSVGSVTPPTLDIPPTTALAPVETTTSVVPESQQVIPNELVAQEFQPFLSQIYAPLIREPLDDQEPGNHKTFLGNITDGRPGPATFSLINFTLQLNGIDVLGEKRPTEAVPFDIVNGQQIPHYTAEHLRIVRETAAAGDLPLAVDENGAPINGTAFSQAGGLNFEAVNGDITDIKQPTAVPSVEKVVLVG